MKRSTIIKYTTFLLVVASLVGLDQWTKWYAEQRLATQRPGYFSHNMILEIGPEFEGSTLENYLREELRWSSDEEVLEIAQNFTLTEHGQRLGPESELEAGQVLRIRQREVVIIEDYWDFQYTRNPGAAFGLLADADESIRKPFFIAVSLLAVLIILALLKGVNFRQQLLFWGLTLIAAGAVGNFIDRIRFGYVIDFIVWKVTDEHRWPTFNVADALICIGVAFMAIEIIREGMRERHEKKLAAASGKASNE